MRPKVPHDETFGHFVSHLSLRAIHTVGTHFILANFWFIILYNSYHTHHPHSFYYNRIYQRLTHARGWNEGAP